MGDHREAVVQLECDAGTDAYTPGGATSLIEGRGEVEMSVRKETGGAPFREIIAEIRVNAQSGTRVALSTAEHQAQGGTGAHIVGKVVTGFRGQAENGATATHTDELDTTAYIELGLGRKGHQGQCEN